MTPILRRPGWLALAVWWCLVLAGTAASAGAGSDPDVPVGPGYCSRDTECHFDPGLCPQCAPCRPSWRPVIDQRTYSQRLKTRSLIGQCPEPQCPPCSRESNWLGVAPACRAGRCRPAGRGIGYFYTDLDGTLLDKDDTVPERVLKALERFRASGGKVGIATGRMPDRGLTIAKKIGAELPLIFANGAVITDPQGRPLRLLAMDDAAGVQAICQLVSRSACDEVYTGWGNPETGELRVGMGQCGAAPWAGFAPLRIRARRCQRHKRLLAQLDRLLDQPYLVVASGKGRWLGVSVSAPGTGKEKALEFVARRLGARLEQFAYVGDSGNDVAALALIAASGGMCFAMKNATAEASAACPRQTASDNDAGGVAEALDLLLARPADAE